MDQPTPQPLCSGHHRMAHRKRSLSHQAHPLIPLCMGKLILSPTSSLFRLELRLPQPHLLGSKPSIPCSHHCTPKPAPPKSQPIGNHSKRDLFSGASHIRYLKAGNNTTSLKMCFESITVSRTKCSLFWHSILSEQALQKHSQRFIWLEQAPRFPQHCKIHS